MKKWKLLPSTEQTNRNRTAFQGGAYALSITAVVLAILIVLNVLVSALPSSLTKFDISATKLYSITSNTKVVVNALEEDVTITGLYNLVRKMMLSKLCLANMTAYRITSR